MITGTDLDQSALEQFALRLVGAASYSTCEAPAAEELRHELTSLGFSVETDHLGNVIGTRRFGDGPTVLIDGHIDTVPVVDPTLWSHDPAGEVHGGRLYGRGSVDMKGPLAASVHGVAMLGRLSAGTVVISGTVAEELVEGSALTPVVERVRPDYVVIGEPSDLKLIRGQRGRGEVVVEVLGRSCHSAYPSVGINAAEVMADVVVSLRNLDMPTDPFLGPGILVLTDVISEPYPGLSIVPERCIATFDRRTLPGEDEETILEPLRRVVDAVATRWGAQGTVRIAEDRFETYSGVEIVAPNLAPAWVVEADTPIVERAVCGLEAAGLPVDVAAYRFCTNGSATAGVLGIPTIGFGPGEESQAHTVDESVLLSDLHRGALGYAAIVAELLR